MNIHLIAIGGAVMHNLAIALHLKGYNVSGSDDEIFEPSRTRLEKYGLLPENYGWFPERIKPELDAVIVGMHARSDNPELHRARKENIKIFSFPEYLYEQTKNKKRVVIAGSHGKTTITSMIMHVLKESGKKFDYMVGSRLEGFEAMVGLSEESEIAIFEGDEYLTSPLDKRPKFLHYHADIGLISGIAWDHMNVFPDFDIYVDQFAMFIRSINKNGALIYNQDDKETNKLVKKEFCSPIKEPYKAMEYSVDENGTTIKFESEAYTLKIFGLHNMENMAGALKVSQLLGINQKQFLHAMKSFKGAGKRQELLAKNEKTSVYLDFAHAPSKVRATVSAFKERFPGKKLMAVLEIHTFSSLNKDFLPQYKGSLDKADEVLVFYSPEVVKHKKLEAISPEFVKACFGNTKLKVITSKEELKDLIQEKSGKEGVLLLMSSGNFGGIEFGDFGFTGIS
jgi:UDP-N-acetylmuramate: L-alanyl-gamma-D-glutamyl-meso-diaminopimelate ligase